MKITIQFFIKNSKFYEDSKSVKMIGILKLDFKHNFSKKKWPEKFGVKNECILNNNSARDFNLETTK